ncbi:MAG: C39 family peptidase [Alkaliphilus sp.]
MKKIVLLLILSLILSSMSFSFAEDNVQAASIETHKQEISTLKEFVLWNNAKLSFDSVVYNSQGKKLLNLHSVINEFGVIGYMLTDIKTGTVVEFALGASPFDSLFSRNITKDSIESRMNKSVKLIRAGARYLLTEDNFATIKDLHSSNLINENPLDAINKTLSSQSIIVEPKSMWDDHKIISGVPDRWPTGSTPGCGPVAGINIVEYWGYNGYPDLLKDGYTNQSLYDELYDYMRSFPVGDGKIATEPTSYQAGLDIFFITNGRYITDNDSDYFVSKSDFYKLRTEVINNRPGTILYNFGEENYKAHYVTFVGYAQDFMGENYYIIHDLWHSTAKEIYRNWNFDVTTDDDIWALSLIDPR